MNVWVVNAFLPYFIYTIISTYNVKQFVVNIKINKIMQATK